MTNKISNVDVLQLIFGSQWQYAHVTSFMDDPSNITNDRKPICWAGDYYCNQPLIPNSNQFFTVSLFGHEDGRSRRRKSHFAGTYVVGLDDVMEKLPPEKVAKLPQPTYKMNSSLNSEQWFYVLEEPETNIERVNNLLDQLIANGLAPDGNDPGMKGVTRYLRLPDGVNTKAKRIAENGGVPYQCVVTDWHPERRFKLEQLAEPFNVDLDAPRREERTSGAVEIPDHPIINMLPVKSVLSAGRYDITCPWVHDHTDNDDSGTAVFTNDDGSIGFQCHHGHCEDKTASDLLKHLDEIQPGIEQQYRVWRNHHQAMKAFKSITPKYDFTGTKQTYDFMGNSQPKKLTDVQALMDDVARAIPGSDEQVKAVEILLYTIEPYDHAEKLRWHNNIIQYTRWSKAELAKVIKNWQEKWYKDNVKELGFYKDSLYVGDINQFYDIRKNVAYSVDAFQNMYSHLDEDARKTALVMGKVKKVDSLDYVPGKPAFYKEDGKDIANTWTGDIHYGEPGNCERWLNHWGRLGWSDHKDTHLKFMANTIRKPEEKINWALVLGGREGTGKDFLLYPLYKALGRNSSVTSGENLLSDFNEYLLNKKHVHFNEVELGDHVKNREIANRLKPIIAAPPNHLQLNMKQLRLSKIRNIVNTTISSNQYQPLYTDRGSRRYYMAWSDVNPRDENNEMKPEWVSYWNDAWEWMLDPEDNPRGRGGWKQCVYHLVHNVDLSDFNPGAAPSVTDYMREVQELSKSSLELEIERYIQERTGCFRQDLVTAAQVKNTYSMLHTQDRRTSVNTLSKVLSTIGCRTGLRCRIDGVQVRLIAVRDIDRYAAMDGAELAKAYTESLLLAGNSEGQVVDFSAAVEQKKTGAKPV